MWRCIRFGYLGLFQLIAITSLFGEDLRIATYNVKNYLVVDRIVEGRWRPAYPKPEKEKAIIRQIIKEVSPDILVLQEMGSIAFLEELRTDLSREGSVYSYALLMEAADPDRHLAVLSRRYPLEVVKHDDLTFKYFNERQSVKRGMLEVSFELGDGQVFQLFAVHLKSRYTNNKDDPLSTLRRTREAEACRNRLIERTLGQGLTNYMVVGDFNDHPASGPLRRFSRRGDLKLGSMVPASDSRGEVWTYFYKKESSYETIDGFVASPAILKRIQGGWGHIADATGALNGSDHRMVYLDLAESIKSE